MLLAVVSTVSPEDGIVSDQFELNCELEGNTLTISIDTDLPDPTEVIVSVHRVYFEVGNNEAYSRDYFSENSQTIQAWREARKFILDNEKWKAELSEFQSKMAKISSDVAFEIDTIEDQIQVRAVVHVNQPDERFGGRGNPKLSGDAVTDGLFGNLVEEEIHFDFPIDTIIPENKVVAYDGLKKGESYKLQEDTPLMATSPHATPTAKAMSISKTQTLSAGTVIKVIKVTDKSNRKWYEVEVEDEEKNGWINSIALMKEGVILQSTD